MKLVQMNYIQDNGNYEEIYPTLTVRKSTYTGQGIVFNNFNLSTGVPNGSNINPSLFFICDGFQGSSWPGILIFTSNANVASFWSKEKVNGVDSEFVTYIICNFRTYYVSFTTMFQSFNGSTIETNTVQNNSFLSYNALNANYPVMCII